MSLDILVEGDIDSSVVAKIFLGLNIPLGTAYGRRGIGYILEKAQGFSTRQIPIYILVDSMDMPCCVAEVSRRIIPNANQFTLVKAADREIESWIMADRENLANFLGISLKHIPLEPDKLTDPKDTFLTLCLKCRTKKRKESLVLKDEGAKVPGPGYLSEIQFLLEGWDVNRAMQVSPSLRHNVDRLRNFYSANMA